VLAHGASRGGKDDLKMTRAAQHRRVEQTRQRRTRGGLRSSCTSVHGAARLVLLPKLRVAGSNPVVRSKETPR
jgi:hypothetical protein